MLCWHNRHQSVSSSVLNAIVYFADELKVKLIAEGVETPEQAEHLKKLGVQYHQGYLYSKPLPYRQLARQPVTWTDSVSRSQSSGAMVVLVMTEEFEFDSIAHHDRKQTPDRF